jgi:hypothetical protein
MEKIENVFGWDFYYENGWRSSTNIELWNNQNADIYLLAYDSEFGGGEHNITEPQNNALKDFSNHQAKYVADFLLLAMDYYNKANQESSILKFEEEIIPKTLHIDREGSIALLCDEVSNPDEGIAILISPEKKVLSQDDYL